MQGVLPVICVIRPFLSLKIRRLSVFFIAHFISSILSSLQKAIKTNNPLEKLNNKELVLFEEVKKKKTLNFYRNKIWTKLISYRFILQIKDILWPGEEGYSYLPDINCTVWFSVSCFLIFLLDSHVLSLKLFWVGSPK